MTNTGVRFVRMDSYNVLLTPRALRLSIILVLGIQDRKDLVFWYYQELLHI